MMDNLVIRSICCFTRIPNSEAGRKLNEIAERLVQGNWAIETKRICTADTSIKESVQYFGDSVLLNVGTLSTASALAQLDDFFRAPDVYFNIDLSNTTIGRSDIDMLYKIIANRPEKTFNFTYVFNNAPSTPFFPSASYQRDGFSIGLQSTDLSEGCNSIEDWLDKCEAAWHMLATLFGGDADFMGIDSSVAPFYMGKSSLVNFVNRLGLNFSKSATSTIYTTISRHIKDKNPRPIGLCGLMFPCLEDFELAEEYDQGNFTLERNIFLSLHSGLGVDTYPIGTDEKPERVIEILSLLQNLSNKYRKPLSARFVSDGIARIGQKTNFQNPFLKDVVVRPL
jgi:hypothetical protein